MQSRLKKFEEKTGYEFSYESYLEEALTHSSYVREHPRENLRSNERLEYLGDALLDAVVGEILYRRLPDAEEGRLTKLRAAVVCEKTLADISRSLDIGSYLYMGNGEIKQGGRNRESILADAVEALIGAVFLDSSYETVSEFITRLTRNPVEEAISGRLVKDYKSAIQEMLQARGLKAPSYQVAKEEGPDHSKTFFVDLIIDGKVYGSGCGRTKKQAEQNAAREVLERGNS